MTEMQQLQLMAAGVIAVFFFVLAISILRKRHMDGRPWATRGGALVYAIIFAGFVGGIMVPLQMDLMNGGMAEMSDAELITSRLPGLVFFMLVIRSDVTGRLPVVGTFIRAYRSAMLRRTIEGAHKRLEKMQALDGRAATGA
ncbi:hypothetical protein [Parvularcula sp. IMCC14364]|uniref:hypothetical protein n=1 Tax=Parvularcula sp. IMCC14364 TaxID=3067902 RepID=UPI002741FE36|nr:hypothetical protein [Parvularcula sp. IMCC14364]